MSPGVGLWLTLALIGVVISANSYFIGSSTGNPTQKTSPPSFR